MFEKFNIDESLMPSDARFGVGPSKIPQVFVERLAHASKEYLGTSHRKPNVVKVYKELLNGIKTYFQLPEGYEIVIGNGGATFLFDMIGLGLVRKSSVHYSCGEFSNKWHKAHANIPWIDTQNIEAEFGHNKNPENHDGFDMVCATLNETSTGVMLTDLPEVGEDTLLAIDATSGAGQMNVDFSKVDVYFFSAQKVFAGEGGFYISILSPKAIKRAMELDKREEYIPEVMRWSYAIDKSRLAQTFNTPSLSTAFYLNEQLKMMNELGEEEVIRQAKEKAAFVYAWAESKAYLECFVKDKKFRSHAVATINVDSKYSVDELTARLRTLKIAFDIEGYRKLGLNQLRISLFHNVSFDDLKKLTQIISLAIEQEIES